MKRIRILPLLLLLVCVSMIIKVLDITGHYDGVNSHIVQSRMEALAQEEPKASEEPLYEATDSQPVWSPGAPVGPKEVKPSSEDANKRTILESLAKRRQELEEWAKSIALKENILNATRNKINEKMEELKALKQEVSQLLGQYDQKEQHKIDRMVKIYESMKAKDAAKIFEQMDLGILMEVISNMKEKKAAPILASLPPERARQVTERLILQRRLKEER